MDLKRVRHAVQTRLETVCDKGKKDEQTQSPSLDIDFDLDNRLCQDYISSILSSSKWLARRVVTIDSLASGKFKKHVSLDIDTVSLYEQAKNVGIGIPGRYLAIPLGIFQKGLLLDLSVTDNDGYPLPVLTSDKDARIWRIFLIKTLRDKKKITAIQAEDPVFKDEIDHLVAGINSCAELGASPQILAQPGNYLFKSLILKRIADFHPTGDRDVLWQSILASQLFVERLKCAVLNFIPIVAIPMTHRRYMVKYTLEEHDSMDLKPSVQALEDVEWREYEASCEARRLDKARLPMEEDRKEWRKTFRRSNRWRQWRRRWTLRFHRLLQGLGVNSYPLAVDTSQVTFAMREHIRIVCPTGVCIGDAIHGESSVPKSSSPSEPPDALGIARIRITRERAILYTSVSEPVFDPAKTRRLVVGIRPRLRGFFGPAVIVVTYSLILSAAAWIMCPQIVCSSNTIDAATTLLLLTQTLGSMYVASPDEHRYRTAMLRWYRLAIIINGMLTALIAIALAFFGSILMVRWCSGITFGFSVVLLSCLLVLASFSERDKRRVMKDAEVTKDL